MRSHFYKGIRHTLTDSLTQTQVDGFEFLLDRMESDARWGDIRHAAYALATIWHETAATMQPIREYGKGRGRPYGRPHPTTGHTYYGRGYVQLTWIDNYAKASTKLGTDFVQNPDLVMEPEFAYEILTEGMREGWFTGKKLSDYINERGCDYKSARRIINGTDKWELIAKYAQTFEFLLKVARCKTS